MIVAAALAMFQDVICDKASTEKAESTSKDRVISLEESIIAAYNENPSWLAVQTDANAARQAKKEAQFEFVPKVSGSITSSRSADDSEGTENTSIFGTQLSPFHRVRAQTSTEMGIQVRQNLFKGFQSINNIKSKDNSVKAAHYAMVKARGDLLARVIISYVDIWAKAQAFEAYQQKENNLQKLYEAQIVSLEAGVSTRVDVEEARAKYESAKFDRISAKNKLIQAQKTFEYLTGINPDGQLQFPRLSQKDMPKDLESFKNEVRANNPEILQYKFQALAAENDRSAIQAELGPSVDAILSARRTLNKPENHENTSHTKRNNHYDFQLSASLPLLDLPIYSRVQQYSERANGANFKYKDKLSEIMSACETYYDRLNTAEALIKSSMAAVKSSETASTSNLDAVAIGTKSNTEFLDGQNTLLNARIQLVEAQRTRVETIIQILSLTGKLDLQTVFNVLQSKIQFESKDSAKQ